MIFFWIVKSFFIAEAQRVRLFPVLGDGMEAHAAALPTPAGAQGNPDAYRLFGTFRLLLALMVVVSHTHRLAGEGFSKWIGQFGIGNMAVMTFFVLSGFVIAEANELFYNRRTGAFLINRLLRIFPPYFVALAFSVLLHLGVSLVRPLEFYSIIPHPELMFSWQNIVRNILPFVMSIVPRGSVWMRPMPLCGTTGRWLSSCTCITVRPLFILSARWSSGS